MEAAVEQYFKIVDAARRRIFESKTMRLLDERQVKKIKELCGWRDNFLNEHVTVRMNEEK